MKIETSHNINLPNHNWLKDEKYNQQSLTYHGFKKSKHLLKDPIYLLDKTEKNEGCANNPKVILQIL